jgi:hypothetical protein
VYGLSGGGVQDNPWVDLISNICWPYGCDDLDDHHVMDGAKEAMTDAYVTFSSAVNRQSLARLD